MSVAQMFNLNWPVVSVPNGAQSAKKYVKQNIEWIEAFNEVVFAFDNDSDGQKAVAECAQLLTPGKAKVANFYPYKDANEMLKANEGGDIPKRIFNAKEWRPDGIVSGSELSLEYLMTEEDVSGYELQFPKLNEKLKTLRKGELTTLAAGTGAGKSTLAREIAAHLVKEHGLKLGHIALEESVKKSAIGFMAIDLDVPMGDLYLDKSIVDTSEFEKSYEKTIANDQIYFYDHFGSLESDSLMAKIKYLASGLDVDFIVLDHISIVVSGITGGDERRTIDNLMTNLRSIVENTGVGMLLISHLRVPQGQKKAHEEGGRVTLNQLRGSGSIKQLSDNIIAIERDQQADEPNLSNIRLLKNRLFGMTGITDVAKYNIVTGRLLPYEIKDEEINGLDKTEKGQDQNTNFNEEDF
jgi:twinkle protein